MKSRPEIKRQAQSNFSAQYGITLGTFIVAGLLMWACGSLTCGIGAFLLVPPLIVGYYSFFLKIYRGEKGDIGEIFNGFQNYGRSLGGILWMELFTFLWSLLFVIPGIIKSLAYFMTPYILADCPNVRPTQALKLSMRMTKGYKGEIFVMYLSFIGWFILSWITCGILLLFYVGPYLDVSLAGMYEELKRNALAKGVVTSFELA